MLLRLCDHPDHRFRERCGADKEKVLTHVEYVIPIFTPYISAYSRLSGSLSSRLTFAYHVTVRVLGRPTDSVIHWPIYRIPTIEYEIDLIHFGTGRYIVYSLWVYSLRVQLHLKQYDRSITGGVRRVYENPVSHKICQCKEGPRLNRTG
jgi:hypothetical protein